MRKTCALIILLGLASPSNAATRWVQIQPGNSFEYAQAVCDNASMGVGQGYVAWGSPGYVLGAALGNAIGNAILKARYFDNCMIMGGWKKVRTQASPRAQARNNTSHSGEK